MISHIDTEQLAELKEVLEDEFGVLIDTYITDAQLRLRLIQQGINSQDYEAVRLAAHSLKGASANLGAIQLADLCEKLEHDCRTRHYGDFAILNQKIGEEFLIVKEALIKVS